jgi:hypothetical protein
MFRRTLTNFLGINKNINTCINKGIKDININNHYFDKNAKNTNNTNPFVNDKLSKYILKSIDDSMKRKIIQIENEKKRYMLCISNTNNDFVENTMSSSFFPYFIFAGLSFSFGISFLARYTFSYLMKPVQIS